MSRQIDALIGKRFVDGTGQVWVLVDKRQQRQTVGRWVTQADEKTLDKWWELRHGKPGNHLSTWPMTELTHHAQADGFRLGLCFCKLEELDLRENEFGLVSP